MCMVVAAAWLATAAPVSAHDPANHIRVWKRVSQPWRFTRGFPSGGGERARVRDGLRQWQNLGEPLIFSERSEVANFDPIPCPPPTRNAIHYREVDGRWRALAFTRICTESGQITSFQIVFDRDEAWYWGTGDAGDRLIQPLGCEADAWSAASHEWGHAHGYARAGCDGGGHFCESADICADNSDQHTMCPQYRPGSERWRTIEEHDKHTYQQAY